MHLANATHASALFVAIGSGVTSGPLCLLCGFVFWATVVFSVAQCQTEIVTLLPLDGSYIRLAGRMVDPALGVTAGWNLFFSQTSYVIFETTIINTLVSYWSYDQSPAILISVSLLVYLASNIYRADLFGEAEFWLALGKILLVSGLIFYTFVVMLGGNPLHELVYHYLPEFLANIHRQSFRLSLLERAWALGWEQPIHPTRILHQCGERCWLLYGRT